MIARHLSYTMQPHLITMIAVVVAALTFPEKTACAEPAAPGSIDWQYQIVYQRGIEAMNWAVPAVSMLSMRDANFSLGGGFNTIYWLSEAPTARQEALIPNNQTPYASVFLTT